jgi:protein-S-isoprenylcysteine O-methyltransferase Ste14
MKNYVKEGQKLPMFGIGPYLISSVFLVTVIGIVLSCYVFKFGTLDGFWVWIFRIMGALLIGGGIAVWYIGALRSNMDKNISENKLQTSGIYACVRNPMYSGCWMIASGIGFMWHNWMILPIVLITWAILTVVLINTEEKWLLNLYGQEYAEYKKHVNRCIPWFPRK